MRALAFLAALGLAALGVAAPLAAQKPARNAPESNPYTRNDPEVMAAAGIVSHGPFEFGAEGEDTASLDAYLLADVYWVETEHFEIGFALGSYRVSQKEKKKLLAELTKLQAVLPEVDPKTKVLDEWLRAHLFAQRCEEIYARFLEIVDKEPGWFPGPEDPWILGEPFRGTGPHVGQKGKFEVLFLSSEAEFKGYMSKFFGLPVTRTQRWNVIARDTITATIHLEQGSLKVDEALHAHLAFNLAHNLFDGFKHYSYDTPLWIHEGLAHFFEREVSPRYNTFDATEGALPEETRKTKWWAEARKLASKGEAPRMAELVNLQSYAQFELRHHFATWSMVEFLVTEHGPGFACLLDQLKGRTKADGSPDGGRLRDVHREAFQECLGMSYAAFDLAWAEWVKAQSGRKD